jgi:hypothetical protein
MVGVVEVRSERSGVAMAVKVVDGERAAPPSCANESLAAMWSALGLKPTLALPPSKAV